MENIKVLDCTLRDGGYVNNWDFGKENIRNIISLLDSAGTDFIEIGFLRSGNNKSSQSLYTDFTNINDIIPSKTNINKLFGMIAYGEFEENKIPNAENSPIKGIRFIFKKHQVSEALEYCSVLKDKGYKLFINPTFIDQYSEEELLELIEKTNKIQPYGMTIVDSMGVLKEKDLLNLYKLIDDNLDKHIILGFHSHNNLKLSFSNAQALLRINKSRKLIIDSTILGMGRGAGNLCTEVITQYLNDNYGKKYDVVSILKLMDEIIHPIYERTPWGYSVPYYLAALNHCHPNYAKYLIDKQTVPVEVINQILLAIPFEKRSIYDLNLIEEMYNQFIA